MVKVTNAYSQKNEIILFDMTQGQKGKCCTQNDLICNPISSDLNQCTLTFEKQANINTLSQPVYDN